MVQRGRACTRGAEPGGTGLAVGLSCQELGTEQKRKVGGKGRDLKCA